MLLENEADKEFIEKKETQEDESGRERDIGCVQRVYRKLLIYKFQK